MPTHLRSLLQFLHQFLGWTILTSCLILVVELLTSQGFSTFLGHLQAWSSGDLFSGDLFSPESIESVNFPSIDPGVLPTPDPLPFPLGQLDSLPETFDPVSYSLSDTQNLELAGLLWGIALITIVGLGWIGYWVIRLRHQIRQLRRQLNDRQQHIAQLHHQLQMAEQQSGVTQQQVFRLQESLEQQLREQQQQHTEWEQTQQRCSYFQGELETAQQRCATLTAENEALRQQVTNHQQRCANLVNQVNQTTEQITEQLTEQLTEQRLAFEQEVASYEQQCSTLDQQLRTSQQQCRDLQEQVQRLEQQLQEGKNQQGYFKLLEHEYQTLDQNLSRTQQACTQAHKQLRQEQEQNLALVAENTSLSKQLGELSQKLSACQMQHPVPHSEGAIADRPTQTTPTPKAYVLQIPHTKDLDRLQDKEYRQLMKRIVKLQHNPLPHDRRRLKQYDRDVFRIDVGEHRVCYRIHDLNAALLHPGEVVVEIIVVGKRNDDSVYHTLERRLFH